MFKFTLINVYSAEYVIKNMRIKHILPAFIIFLLTSSSLIRAQDNLTSVNYENSGCTKQALEDIIKAINQYRADSKNWNSSVTQAEFTLGGVPEEEKGIIELSINKSLMTSANETAKRFANGTYPQWDHLINGEGPTMRAIRSGWMPTMNKIFNANEEPVFTMVTENLWEGTSRYQWRDVLNAWKNSPGHNTTLLSRGAVSIGCGCADTKDQQESYWVLLVEMEDSMTESDAVMEQYFKEGIFYKRKNGVKRSDLSKIKAVDAYEFIEDGLDKIRDAGK